MNDTITIEPLSSADSPQIVDLILPIQQLEFNVPITLDGQPDLLDLETYYHSTGGSFWGAKSSDQLLGTIALIAFGESGGCIRKMFVRKEYRGKELGLAQQLLETLITYCRESSITDLYLGTVDQLRAAHRFYERNDFQRIDEADLPADFPKMKPDTIFYHLHLK
ncbi:MAG: GNAT family N-acetyltransferase [Bacteroidetes bacterium]|nr:GNAT family N-acetyltransferase [Bacteroidota bacterium]